MRWMIKKSETPQPSIEEKQAEILVQLGAKLANLRQEKGLSLDEIVLMTRIPRRLLKAIETGNLQDLPEPIYTQGLIRQFAEALGLKGVDFASEFPISSQRISCPSDKLSQPWLQLQPFHLYLLYVFVIVCSVTGLSLLLNQNAIQAQKSENQQKLEKTSGFTPQRFENQGFDQITTEFKSANTDTVEINVTLQSSSWIRVVSDGKTEFEGVLPTGSRRNWQATQELTITTNDAGAVLMSINNQPTRKMGKPGKKEKIRVANQVSS